MESAVDAALIARYYERFADHAVAIARQVGYLDIDRISEPEAPRDDVPWRAPRPP
jgi:phosphate transport system protein